MQLYIYCLVNNKSKQSIKTLKIKAAPNKMLNKYHLIYLSDSVAICYYIYKISFKFEEEYYIVKNKYHAMHITKF